MAIRLLGALVLLGACGRPHSTGASDAASHSTTPWDSGIFSIVDAGSNDAGLSDAGSRDAGTNDGGAVDAGPVDAGFVDAGSNDGGIEDAGSDDGGEYDAGPDFGYSDDAGPIDDGMDPFAECSSDGGVADSGVAAALPDGGIDDGGPADAGLMLVDAGVAPDDVYAAVGKVKDILLGLPPTDAEASLVAADSNALFGLVGQWMAAPQYQPKMLAFLSNAFQQTEINFDELQPQFLIMPRPPFFSVDQPQFMQNVAESYGRTALQLVADGQPFTTTMTTRQFMMTPALVAAYALLDDIPEPDTIGPNGDKDPGPVVLPYMTLVSTGPIPIEESFDPASPNYLKFYDPLIATQYQPGCPTGTIYYPSGWIHNKQLEPLVLEGHAPPFNYDTVNQVIVLNPGPNTVACAPPNNVELVQPSDFTSWMMVNVRPPVPGEATTKFYNLAALRTSCELVLNIPRQGFFSTLAFFGQWATNQSNLARVTVNQTMIVGLGLPIDTSNTTVPNSEVAVDESHAAPGSDCYLCHQSLDPMRQFFRQAYTLDFSLQSDPAETSLPGQFAFHGVSTTGTSIFDLGTQLASHPFFATAWVQKLCAYANSAPCDETDPEFARLVTVFTDSNYSWNALVQALFSSPLVTNLTATQNAQTNGVVYPIARQANLCALLSNRLGVPDVCGLDAETVQPADLAGVQIIASSWPSDEYSRGSPIPVLANSPSLFMRSGLENICVGIAQHVIDNPDTGQFDSMDPEPAIQSFVTNLMGLGGDRAPPALAILQDHFASAQMSGADASDSLKSTFVLACESPYVAGVGL